MSYAKQTNNNGYDYELFEDPGLNLFYTTPFWSCAGMGPRDFARKINFSQKVKIKRGLGMRLLL
jgi:hypothetical protein